VGNSRNVADQAQDSGGGYFAQTARGNKGSYERMGF